MSLKYLGITYGKEKDMRKQRIYFEWFGLIWKITPENLLRWIKDVQSKKECDIGDYGVRHKAKKLPVGLYQYKGGDRTYPPSTSAPNKEVCILNMTDWEEQDLKLIKKQVEEYLSGKRPYVENHRCR